MDANALGITLVLSILISLSEQSVKRPNVIVLMADDLGIGDIGCYGNKTITTPNIDRLCEEGAKFTHHLAAASLCTPSRAAFLTGRLPIRMGMTGDVDTPPVIVYTAGRAGIPDNETTWAKVLERNGYQTAAIGKWHVGWDDTWKGDQLHGPLGHGFQYFYGLPYTLVDGFDLDIPFFTYSGMKEKDHPLHNHMVGIALSLLTVCAVYSKNFGYTILVMIVVGFCITWFFVEHFKLHTNAWWRRSLYMEKFLNSHLMENRRVEEQPIDLSKLSEKLTSKAVEFLRKSKDSADQPFALYFAFPNVHVPLVPSKKSRGKSKHGRYGDSLLDLDSSIGEILDTLEEIGQTENTLVFFTSDHGSHINLGRQGGSNRPFRGGKGIDALEGAIRVPAIIRWPAMVKAQSVIETPTSLMDFLPTIQEAIKDEDDTLQLDGESYLSLLRGKPLKKSSRIIRHYCRMSLHALRLTTEDGNVYKAYFREPILNEEGHCGTEVTDMCPCYGDGIKVNKIPVVYDVKNDPEERSPLVEKDARYLQLLPEFLSHFEIVENEWHPPSQFSSMSKVMPMPWLQPCARFPLCKS